jgi:hypothetical protein
MGSQQTAYENENLTIQRFFLLCFLVTDEEHEPLLLYKKGGKGAVEAGQKDETQGRLPSARPAQSQRPLAALDGVAVAGNRGEPDREERHRCSTAPAGYPPS